MTLRDFVDKYNIVINNERTDANPNVPDWHDADHWKVTLKRGEKEMVIYFSKGYGHQGKEPDIEEVLECLMMDAIEIINSSNFEEWAENLGFDPDSRKAERIYKLTKQQTKKLKTFLGKRAFNELLDYFYNEY